jgi:hypothetical protein
VINNSTYPITINNLTVSTLTVTNQFISQSTSIFNGPVIVNGTTTFNNTVIFTTTPSIPLAQHHLFVGNASNIAAEFAPSSTDGQMLTSVGGALTWTTPASGSGTGNVNGNGLVNRVAKFNVNGSTITSGSIVDLSASTSVYINAGGNVGIATTTANNFKLEVAGDAGPNSDNLYDLGSSSNRWQDIYGVNLHGDGSNITNISTSNITNLTIVRVSSSFYSSSATVSTNLLGGQAGVVPYQYGTNLTSFTVVGSSGSFLQSTGSGAPIWVTTTSLLSILNVTTVTYSNTSSTATYSVNSGSANIATNLLGGAAGRVVYQSAVNVTSFTATGNTGDLLQSNNTGSLNNCVRYHRCACRNPCWASSIITL